MKKLLLAALLAALAPAARAQGGDTIKLGTLAPQGSTWHELLKEMGQRWEQASGGQVKLRIYAGGAQGSEGDMVRKMGIGQLQAAAISNVGMHDVIPEPQALLGAVPVRGRGAAWSASSTKVRPRSRRRSTSGASWRSSGAASAHIHLFCARRAARPPR